MLVEKITSRQNPLVKRFRFIRAGGERHHVFLEGVRLIEDAIRAGAHIETVAFSPQLETTERGLALLDRLQQIPCRGAHVSKQVMDAIADTESPQGVAAIVSRPHFEIKDVMARPPQLIVIADELQDPGNLGTIIRTAEAAGATGLITTRFTVDPFNHKALRASMGSALRFPIATDLPRSEAFDLCRERGIKIIALESAPPGPLAVVEDGEPAMQIYTEAKLTGPVALVCGRESSGIAAPAAAAADALVHIPMADGVESLNVSAAAAVLLYEAARQRRSSASKTKNGERI
ncbi:MAG TPA: RNA methyltransferase [Blastocatellia bacterium]|nr:RNA methyltransferase [Blastocatellia bacterium]